MISFKLQLGEDIRRKTVKDTLSFEALTKLVVHSFLQPELTYDFTFTYEDSDEDEVTIADSTDLSEAFQHHSGDLLKIYISAQEINPRKKAYQTAFNTGYRLLENGRPEEAIPHFAEALKHKKDPLSAYNIACAFAILENIVESLKWFRAAVDLGYNNWIWALRDSDLENVRDTEEFHQLIDVIRSRLRGQGCPLFWGCPSKQRQCRRPADAPSPSQPTEKSVPPQPTETFAAPPPPVASAPSQPSIPPYVPSSPASSSSAPEPTDSAYAQLASMGFVDQARNERLLQKHKGDMVKVIHELLFA